MDIKAEFKNILIKYGHNVFIQRRTSSVGDGPYNRAEDKYTTTLEKWTTYRTPLRTGATASADGFMKLDDEGMSTNFDMCFYFQPESEIKTSDKVIEDTPHENKRRHIFLVKKAVPYYFGRELIYIAAYCDKILPTDR